MEELSTAQMSGLRGGVSASPSPPIALISLGNIAIAIPVDIIVLSGNAIGPGARAGIGNITQTATANAGTQLLNLFKFF
jgi:hypothetical protein